MSFCDYFKQYIHDPADSIRDKHVFYRIDDWYDEVKNTEKELGITIPEELKEIYKELGYGFLCASDDNFCVNRIMPPTELVDFYLGRDIYEFNEVREDYADSHYNLNCGKLVFFEQDSDFFLTVGLTPDDQGRYPVDALGQKIADSVQEFLMKMDKKTNYYFDMFPNEY